MNGRSLPLDPQHQREILRQAIPSRLSVLHQFLKSSAPSYELTVASAVFSRAIAGFLGLGLKKGKLAHDRDHFEQEKKASWEVKITDISGGKFIDIASLSTQQKLDLENGLREVNTAFAHITFWADPNNQNPCGSPSDDYINKQQKCLRNLASAVMHIFKESSKNLQV